MPGWSPVGSAVTVTTDGWPGLADAEAGATESHPAPLLTEALAVNINEPPPTSDTLNSGRLRRAGRKSERQMILIDAELNGRRRATVRATATLTEEGCAVADWMVMVPW